MYSKYRVKKQIPYSNQPKFYIPSNVLQFFKPRTLIEQTKYNFLIYRYNKYFNQVIKLNKLYKRRRINAIKFSCNFFKIDESNKIFIESGTDCNFLNLFKKITIFSFLEKYSFLILFNILPFFLNRIFYKLSYSAKYKFWMYFKSVPKIKFIFDLHYSDYLFIKISEITDYVKINK
jgi:hypothetical protein